MCWQKQDVNESPGCQLFLMARDNLSQLKMRRPGRLASELRDMHESSWQLGTGVNFHWTMVAAPPYPPIEHAKLPSAPVPHGALSGTKPVPSAGMPLMHRYKQY